MWRESSPCFFQTPRTMSVVRRSTSTAHSHCSRADGRRSFTDLQKRQLVLRLMRRYMDLPELSVRHRSAAAPSQILTWNKVALPQEIPADRQGRVSPQHGAGDLVITDCV